VIRISRAPIALCLTAIAFAACAASTPSPAPPSVAHARVAPDGPDAEQYGASKGYPIGDRSTYFQVPFLVGA